MRRCKSSLIIFMLIALCLFIVPVQAQYEEPIRNFTVVQNFPDVIYAGNVYEARYLFDNVAGWDVPVAVNLTVKGPPTLEKGEFMVKMTLNGEQVSCEEVLPGAFRSGIVFVNAASQGNSLVIEVSSLLRIQPGNYTVAMELWSLRGHVEEVVSTVEGEIHVVNATAAADTVVEVGTKANESVAVTVVKYKENPHPEAPLPQDVAMLPKYIDISVSDPDVVVWPIYVKMSYTTADLAGMEEGQLIGLFYWSGTAWIRCSATGVNTTDFNGYNGYLWANMTKEELSGSPIVPGADTTPPIAVISASPTSGTLPLTVSFSGASSTDNIGIISYYWNFGDGTASSGVAVTHTYTAYGTYTATLSVKDAALNTGTGSLTITVSTAPPPPTNKRPVADAGPDQTAYVNETVHFNGAGSYDPDGTIVGYAWSFGDGEMASGVEVSHSYLEPNSYTVTLTVRDNGGKVGTDTCIVTVTEIPPKMGTLSVDTEPVKGEVFVDGESWGVAPQIRELETGLYEVSFGEVLGYMKPGPIEVEVKADETTEVSGTYVELPPETGVLSIDTTPVKGEVFVDGESWGVAPQSKVMGVGTYTVSFGEVSGYVTPEPVEASIESGLTTNILGTYTEKQPPVADADGPYYGGPGVAITFDGTGSSDPDGIIVEYEWDFGDGGIGEGPTPSHVYSSVGKYTVTLTVTDDDGLTDGDTTTATVRIPTPPNERPVADAGPDQTAYVNETVHFNGAGSYDPDGTIVGYAWSFGDGVTAFGETTSHSYSEPGNYTVTLTVEDNKGAEDTDTCKVKVSEPPKPAKFEVSNLTITPAEVEPGEEITISALVTNVGDLEGSTTVYLRVNDTVVGTRTVTLKGGESTAVSFTLTEEEPGTYVIGVDELTGDVFVFRPATFELSNLAISPKEVLLGGSVTVSATVVNLGDVEGDYTVTLYANGAIVGTKAVTILGGGSETVQFTLTEKELGTYAVELDGLTGSFRVLKPATFELSNLTIAPAEVETGKLVTISATMTNTGEVKGSCTVTLLINNAVEDSETISLDGGKSTTVSFSATKAAGEYSVKVDGLTGSFKVVSPPQPFPWEYLAIAVIVIVVIAIIIIIWIKRR